MSSDPLAFLGSNPFAVMTEEILVGAVDSLLTAVDTVTGLALETLVPLSGSVTANLMSFLNPLQLGSSTFTPAGAAEAFVLNIINPTGLLTTATSFASLVASLPTEFAALGTDGLLLTSQLPNSLLQLAEADVASIIAAPPIVAGIQTTIAGIQTAITTLENDLLVGPSIIMDIFYNEITGGNASGVTTGQFTSQVSGLVTSVETALNSANKAIYAVQQFGGLLHQIVFDLAELPAYVGIEDFISAWENIATTVWDNVTTALSPNNPPVSANISQINALWAHLNSGTSGINWDFASAAMTANYPNTSNVAWTPPSGFSLPSVSGNYALESSAAPGIGVFTGNPSNAATDHGLITNKNHVGATVKAILNYGAAGIFICGHGTTGLAQHVLMKLDYQVFGWTLSLFVSTSPNVGTDEVSYSLSSVSVDDTIAIEYDDAGHFTMYHNGMEVGTPWADTTSLTHGAGWRECGIYEYNNGSGAASIGLGAFVAYDY
jgi:hypothetical protein